MISFQLHGFVFFPFSNTFKTVYNFQLPVYSESNFWQNCEMKQNLCT